MLCIHLFIDVWGMRATMIAGMRVSSCSHTFCLRCFVNILIFNVISIKEEKNHLLLFLAEIYLSYVICGIKCMKTYDFFCIHYACCQFPIKAFLLLSPHVSSVCLTCFFCSDYIFVIVLHQWTNLFTAMNKSIHQWEYKCSH